MFCVMNISLSSNFVRLYCCLVAIVRWLVVLLLVACRLVLGVASWLFMFGMIVYSFGS